MSEDKPHIVYAKGRKSGLVTMFENHADAKAFWVLKHDTLAHPYMIATVGREIDPATPIVDVNE